MSKIQRHSRSLPRTCEWNAPLKTTVVMEKKNGEGTGHGDQKTGGFCIENKKYCRDTIFLILTKH